LLDAQIAAWTTLPRQSPSRAPSGRCTARLLLLEGLAVVERDAAGRLGIGGVPHITCARGRAHQSKAVPTPSVRAGLAIPPSTCSWQKILRRTRRRVVRHVEVRAEGLEAVALEEGHVRVEVVEHTPGSHDENRLHRDARTILVPVQLANPEMVAHPLKLNSGRPACPQSSSRRHLICATQQGGTHRKGTREIAQWCLSSTAYETLSLKAIRHNGAPELLFSRPGIAQLTREPGSRPASIPQRTITALSHCKARFCRVLWWNRLMENHCSIALSTSRTLNPRGGSDTHHCLGLVPFRLGVERNKQPTLGPAGELGIS
jgi:hypothetical protein